MKKVLCSMGLVFGALFTVVGCGDSTPEGEEVPEDVLMRESSENSGTSETLAGAVSCSYVQYCNAPGELGTVCKYTNGCDSSTSYAECLREVREICGSSPVYPAARFYYGP